MSVFILIVISVRLDFLTFNNCEEVDQAVKGNMAAHIIYSYPSKISNGGKWKEVIVPSEG